MAKRWEDWAPTAPRATKPHVLRILESQADRIRSRPLDLDQPLAEGSASGNQQRVARGSSRHDVAATADFLINNVPHLVPLQSLDAGLIRATTEGAALAVSVGGFAVELAAPELCTRLVLLDVEDPEKITREINGEKERLLELCNRLTESQGPVVSSASARAVGPHHIEVELGLGPTSPDREGLAQRVGHFLAPRLAELSGGRVAVRVHEREPNSRLVTVTLEVPEQSLDPHRGRELAMNIAGLSTVAENEPAQAAFLNRHLLGGVAAALKAKQLDYRAVLHRALAFAHQDAKNRALARWVRTSEHSLRGRLALPVAQAGLDAAPVELASVIASVGLAANLSQLRWLAEQMIADTGPTEITPAGQ